MKKKTQYTEAFRRQALEKVYTRGSRTVIAVAAAFLPPLPRNANINPHVSA